MTETDKPQDTPQTKRGSRIWWLVGLMLALAIAAALIYLPSSPLVQNAYDSEGTDAPNHGQAALWLRIGFWGLVLLAGVLLFRIDHKDAKPDE